MENLDIATLAHAKGKSKILEFDLGFQIGFHWAEEAGRCVLKIGRTVFVDKSAIAVGTHHVNIRTG